jgi:hypothetical protein
MHTISVFDKFEFVEKLATSSKIPHRETPRSNKYKG